jgi:biopolymer transport protein ExbD
LKLPPTHSNDSLELKMTPMIDVVFLLLVFFVWTSSFELPEFDLPSAIAEPPSGGSELSSEQRPTEVFDEIVIRLLMQDANVVIQMNGQTVDDIDALRTRIGAIIALGVQPPVIIDPAEQIRISSAVEVYDAARAAGADRVLFAAQPE